MRLRKSDQFLYLFNSSGQTTLPILALTVFLLTAIGGGVYFYLDKENTSKMYAKKIEALNGKIITLSERIKEVDIDNVTLKTALESAQKDAAAYKKKYEEATEVSLALAEMKTSLTNHFARFEDSLNAKFGKFDEFSSGVDSRIDKYLTSSKKEISDILQKKTAVQQRTKKISDQVELPEIVVTPRDKTSSGNQTSSFTQKASVTAPAKTAQVKAAQQKTQPQVKVMKVNQRHKFFVLNKGMIDGMKVGHQIEVYRGSVKVGRAIVTEVRELISLAEIQEQFGGYLIESGDFVKLL